jgi:hypothetical protein
VADDADALRTWLEAAEDAVDVVPAVVYLAAPAVHVGEDERQAALRRALLVLAAGGDPHRELEPDGPSVRALASDLDRPDRREQLTAGLERLSSAAEGLPRVAGAIELLLSEPERAWGWYATTLLADELGGDS